MLALDRSRRCQGTTRGYAISESPRTEIKDSALVLHRLLTDRSSNMTSFLFLLNPNLPLAIHLLIALLNQLLKALWHGISPCIKRVVVKRNSVTVLSSSTMICGGREMYSSDVNLQLE